jgi:hypothetical protein
MRVYGMGHTKADRMERSTAINGGKEWCGVGGRAHARGGETSREGLESGGGGFVVHLGGLRRRRCNGLRGIGHGGGHSLGGGRGATGLLGGEPGLLGEGRWIVFGIRSILKAQGARRVPGSGWRRTKSGRAVPHGGRRGDLVRVWGDLEVVESPVIVRPAAAAFTSLCGGLRKVGPGAPSEPAGRR